GAERKSPVGAALLRDIRGRAPAERRNPLSSLNGGPGIRTRKRRSAAVFKTAALPVRSSPPTRDGGRALKTTRKSHQRSRCSLARARLPGGSCWLRSRRSGRADREAAQVVRHGFEGRDVGPGRAAVLGAVYASLIGRPQLAGS